MKTTTYTILRNYADGHRPLLMITGLTLEEAQTWCNDLQTSSRTCTAPEDLQHTEEHGPWFDSYVEERETLQRNFGRNPSLSHAVLRDYGYDGTGCDGNRRMS